MQKTGLFLIIFFWIVVNVHGQDFYDVETINTIELYFSEPNWDYILDNLMAAGDEERLIGTAVINGVQFDSVGVRYKGNSSYQPNQVKNPFNIKLDHVIDNQTLDGYGTLKLANCFKDPSFVREVLSYEIARKYMAASKSNFANVYVNGDLIGLYSSVQSVDKFFLTNHFYSEENAFIKGELTNVGPGGIQVWGYYGSDSTSYSNYYEMKSDYGWSELIDFLYTFNYGSTTLEEVLDVDNHLWMLAFDILMVNLDAPVNYAHNFYLYKDHTEQFNPIIWDLNENFGAFSILMSGPPLSVYEMQQLDPFLNISNPDYPIINKVLPDPTYQKMYIAHMKTIIEENFGNDWYLDRALEIQDIIDADVQADPNKFYSYNNFLNNIYSSVGSGPMSIVGITQLMDTRITYLNNHSAFQGTPPTISSVTYSPTTVVPNSTVWFNADVNGANEVILGFRQTASGKFEKTEMFDDGNHNDGAAGDGIYGISIEAGSTDIHYYVYAENNDAGAFLPVWAEYKYYEIRVNSEIVINEFMADNETTIADPQGEYNDWIELYNSGASGISLLGMYLTDDLSIPGKWAFPDTAIESGNFLLIWADEDESDPGLHASFKLDKDGEEIGLYLDDAGTLVLMDFITFGVQDEDTSYGRYPDGSEDWYQLDPTPSWANQLMSGFNFTVELIYNYGSPLPSGGGNINFDVFLQNNETGSVNFDLWIEIPPQVTPPSVPNRNLTFPGGFSITRPDMDWPIPASWPAGAYWMEWYIGDLSTTTTWASDSFPFVKSADDDGSGFTLWEVDGDPLDQLFEDTDMGEEMVVGEFALLGVYPNPFNPTTVLSYKLQVASFVNLTVYDINGRQVAELINGWRDMGVHDVTFDATGLSSGIYIYRLEAGEYTTSGKSVLMK